MEKSWPADKVERRSIAELLPAARNSRTHTPHQVAQVAASIQKWGFTNPVLVDESGTIIAGHARVLASKALGLSEVPVMVAAGWSDADKRAYLIADNQLALNAEWDERMLRLELTELKSLDFDLGALGFSEVEIDFRLGDGANDPALNWNGMPSYTSEDKTAFRSIIIHFEDQGAVDDFAKLIGQTFTPKTRWTWYPVFNKDIVSGKRYAASGANGEDKAA